MWKIMSAVQGGLNAADQTLVHNTVGHEDTNKSWAKWPTCLWPAFGLILYFVACSGVAGWKGAPFLLGSAHCSGGLWQTSVSQPVCDQLRVAEVGWRIYCSKIWGGGGRWTEAWENTLHAN